MQMKSEIRNPKAESKSEIRNPNPAVGPLISDFGLRASFGFRISVFGFLLVFGLCTAAPAQTIPQTFSLRSGWNSIWLDVEPVDPAVATVLAGAPLVSVWTFADRLSAVDFVEDTAEPVWNRDRWLRFVPTNHPAAFQNNLFTMPGKRAYLIQLTNAFTLTVTGRPAWRARAWVPDAYNLRGFPVDPAGPPTFQEFFRFSPAHFDAAAGHLQKIYRLAATGQWTLVAPTDVMRYGEACWVFAHGGSDYVAPFNVTLEGGDGLDFGSQRDARKLTFANLRDANTSVGLRDLAASSALSYVRFNPTNVNEWVALSGTVAYPLAGGASLPWRTRIRRSDLASGSYNSVLEITDGQGTRFQIPVTADALTAAAAGGPASGGGPAAAGGASDGYSLAGLWMGHASIAAVNEVNTTHAGTNTPTAGEFNLRLLLHVDRNGTVRLLKEVTQLWKDGVATNNAAGQAVVQTPGHFVLVTEESLFAQFSGATLRDGTQAGRRLSAIGYDFPTAAGANYLLLAGAFGGNNELTGTITLTPQSPTNPFRHKYHPDHDNLDDRFANFKAESYEVTRTLSLEFSSTAPAGFNDPDYGYRVQGGTYRETVTGLNKSPITCQGTFRLTRLSDIGVLNQ